LEKLEERKHLALLKNLEYVARVEDERLRERLAKVQEAQAYYDQMEDRHNHFMEQRILKGNAKNSTQAGIGTEQRQRFEKKRKQQQVVNDSVSIYVSNLPQDDQAATEELMTALFGSYGSLRKIHLYTDRQTGELKGDCLVIYNLEDGENRSTLTDAVCSQVRCFIGLLGVLEGVEHP
jgi:hypothetical protein